MDEQDGVGGGSTSQWRSIRPWSPRFILTVREITSVSATFLLTSTLNAHSDPSLASLGLTSSSDDEDTLDDGHVISETLNKSLSVNVNAAPWKRFIMRMDDDGNEAIIILYGLMPGRQYDIELGIMSGEREEIIHSQMTTQAEDHMEQGSSTKKDDPTSFTDTVTTPSKGVSASANNSPNHVPVTSPPRTITVEERTAQLRHQLTQLAADRDGLSAQLKTTRKDAQKADALLRSEIDGLRRASEKLAPAEHRARQKVLALQEAVKQTLAATEETEALVRELESNLPGLQAREKEIEREHTVVQGEARRSKEESDEAVRVDKKRVGELQSELAGLGNRLDKLTGKKEKLANDTIPELEEQLAKLTRDIELVERDSHEFDTFDDGSPVNQNPNFASRQCARPLQPPAPIGSQRPTFQHQHQQQFGSNVGSGSSSGGSSRMLFSSPPNHFQQSPRSGNLSGMNQSPASSTLSSRAPPFDPTFRLGHRPFATQPSLDGYSTSAIPPLSNITSDLHSGFPAARSKMSSSTNPPYMSPFASSSLSSTSGSNVYINGHRSQPSPPLSAHTVFGSDSAPLSSPPAAGGRSNSPVRQSSLPLNMSSISQITPPQKWRRDFLADL